jgi:hypothetical protein
MNRSISALLSFITVLVLLGAHHTVQGQSIIYNRFDVLERRSATAFDSSRVAFERAVLYKEKSSSEDYFSWLPLYSHTSFNSDYARGVYDGYFWQGAGWNQTFSTGVQGRWGNLEYTFAPQLVYSQNKDYHLRKSYGDEPEYQNRFSYPIDYVMQYGNGSVTDIYFGQSEITYSKYNARLSLSTQNTIWGPVIFNPAMMSNHANGFPYVGIGTDKPWNTRAGLIEIQWQFGITQESDYFNDDPKDDEVITNGFVMRYQPSFLPGFSVSLQRSLRLQLQDADEWSDYIMLFRDFARRGQRNARGEDNETADQIFSIGAEYRVPSNNFKIYFEWIRGDFASDIFDFLTQLEHNAGYTIGIAKDFYLESGSRVRVNYEHANLAVWETARIRNSGSLYEHHHVRQGHTNNGQVLGAAIGPGSSFHALSVGYNIGHKSILFEYFRTRYNDDEFYLYLFDEIGNYQDIEHYFGVHWKSRVSNNLEYQIGGSFAVRDNYLFKPDNVHENVHLQMILRYHFMK